MQQMYEQERRREREREDKCVLKDKVSWTLLYTVLLILNCLAALSVLAADLPWSSFLEELWPISSFMEAAVAPFGILAM